jgi:hypothetical protein
MNTPEDDELAPEYDLRKLGIGVRAKYLEAPGAEAGVVLIDADLRRLFPDSRTVNDALREFLRSRPRLR